MHGASRAVTHSPQDFSWRTGSSKQASNKDRSQFSSLRYIQLVLISYYDLLPSLLRSRFFGMSKNGCEGDYLSPCSFRVPAVKMIEFRSSFGFLQSARTHIECVWPPCCGVLRHAGCCWLNMSQQRGQTRATCSAQQCCVAGV